MKRRWLLTAWILSLLTLGAWAGTSPAPCPPAEQVLPSGSTRERSAPEQCCCCSDEAAQICCGCGCDVAQAPLPVSPSGSAQGLARDFVPLVFELPLRSLAVRTAVRSAPSVPRCPRQLPMLAGRADWRGPPALA